MPRLCETQQLHPLYLKEKTVYPHTKFPLIINVKNCVSPHKMFSYIKGKNFVQVTRWKPNRSISSISEGEQRRDSNSDMSELLVGG